MTLKIVDGQVVRTEVVNSILGGLTYYNYARAISRAVEDGTKILTSPGGLKFATSSRENNVIYPLSLEGGCTCLGYTNGNLCKHYALLLKQEGLS